MNACEQLDLDFRGPVGDGYARWAWDRAETERRVAALINNFLRITVGDEQQCEKLLKTLAVLLKSALT